MALHSALDIDVNDEQFKSFQSLFEKYQAQLQKMPGAWAATDKHMKSSFESVAAALLAQNEQVRRAKKAEDDLKSGSDKTAKSWKDMVKSTKSVAGNIKDATTSLLKWASIAGVVSGIIGGGGLFGLDLLAANVGTNRRSALGIGTSIGEQRAFNLNYSRVVDSESFLSGVNAALHDVTKRGVLYNAGLRPSDIEGKDTAQVSVELLQKLKQLADRTPEALLGQVLQSRGLDQIIPLERFEGLRKTPASELNEYQRSYGQDVKALGVDDHSAKVWQDFNVQLSRAGQKIENVFVTGLIDLVGPLDKFSDAVVDGARVFLGSDGFKALVKDAGKWIGDLAKDIEDGDFQKKLREFADDVVAVTRALVNALKWLDIIPNHDKAKKDAPKQSALSAAGTLLNPFNVSPSQNGQAFDTLKKWLTTSARDPNAPPTYFSEQEKPKPGPVTVTDRRLTHTLDTLNERLRRLADASSSPTASQDVSDSIATRPWIGRPADGPLPNPWSPRVDGPANLENNRWNPRDVQNYLKAQKVPLSAGDVKALLQKDKGHLSEADAQAFLKKHFPGIRITGGARSKERNDELEGSARNSMHLTGEAVDLVLPKGLTFAEFKKQLKAAGFPVTELLNEGRHGAQGPHTHVGWRPTHKQPKPQPQKVEIAVNNNTGGNVHISSNQVAR